jgi:hypothetical protein
MVDAHFEGPSAVVGSVRPPKRLYLVFTRDDILSLLAQESVNDTVILYHGIDREHELEAANANLFFAHSFLDYDVLSAIRLPLRLAIGRLTGESGPMWHNQNAVFLVSVQYVAILAAGMIAMKEKFDILELVVCGSILSGYMPLQEAEYEVVKRREWFPEYFYTRYVRQLADSLSLPLRIVPSRKKRIFPRIRAAIRPFLADSARLFLLIRRNLHLFGWRAFLLSAAHVKAPDGPIDDVIFLRSHAGVDYLANYARWLQEQGRSVVLIVSEQLTRFGALRYAQAKLDAFPTMLIPAFEGPVRVLCEFIRGRYHRSSIRYEERVSVSYGAASFDYEIGWAAREIDRSCTDLRLYQQAIRRLLSQLEGRKPVCVSAEIVSYFASVEAEESLRIGSCFWNTEQGPFEKRCTLRIAPGTGYAPQTILGERLGREGMPWEADRIHHPGSVLHPWLELKPAKMRHELRTVVFFTQPKPTNEDHNRLIADALVEAAESLGFSLVIKAHPRDLYDYHSRWNSSRVRIADRLSERSEALTRVADCVISRYSTTLAEALYWGIPYMAILLEDQHRNIQMESVAPELKVRHYTVEKMVESLKVFSEYAENYYACRETFLAAHLRVPLERLGPLASLKHYSYSS